MKITIANNEKEFYSMVAWRIVSQIITKKTSTVGMSTGRTTEGIHKALASIYKENPFETSQLTVFNLDEIINISREYFGSCYYMILNEVVKPLNIPIKNFIMPPTYSDDFESECRKFEDGIANSGGIDLQILGIGENGHLGFNQPGTSFGQTTWLSYMDKNLDKRIRSETNSTDDADLRGLTIGTKNIMQSKKIILAANGARKASIIKAALYGRVDESIPASVLQLHPDCEVILDPAAAAEL